MSTRWLGIAGPHAGPIVNAPVVRAPRRAHGCSLKHRLSVASVNFLFTVLHISSLVFSYFINYITAMSYHSRQPSIASSLISNGTTHNHPAKIGPWRLGKTLGRGATGRVLLGTHVLTGQKAAVKVVSKSELNEDYDPAANGGLPYGIEREIIIMKLLTHPNVLRLYDVWETSKALYLVLEYVEGGELFDLLVERGPLSEVEAVKYFRQIILGTAYCHALGICHRDLKPENLLLDANLNVKLADFGMAALELNGKLLETSCGSPHYAAPEIVSGLKYHGAASDIWLCGVILFALLTGRLPFDDENIRNLLLKVQAGNFDMPEELSDDAVDLISRMLTVDPLARIPTGKILSHPLLNKYPIPNEDLISVKSLPHPQTAYKSLGSIKNIDKQILQNLSILWHDRPQQEIVECLLKNGANAEKTFYALLLRYRHNQEDLAHANAQLPESSSSLPRGLSLTSLNKTPKKKRVSQISASLARTRPVLFQYKNGVKTSTGRLSTASSVHNSPYKLPRRRSVMRSPHKSPYRSPYRASPKRRLPMKSPSKSPHKSPLRRGHDEATPPPAIPRNIYNEIVNAQKNGLLNSMPPTLPSKDSIYKDDKEVPVVDEVSDSPFNALGSAPSLSPKKKRQSMIKSMSKNRLSRRKSIRNSMTTGLKRNSITVKLLSTYAKLAGESDWEYVDKQTRRTSATFATLCDKIFNQEEYDEDEENLVDEEEKQAREYERLMEAERKKHEAEVKARKELAKQKRRSKRKSLLSSKKLAIIVKEDQGNNSEHDIQEEAISQPKRQSRALSEGVVQTGLNDELTSEDVEQLKRRSVTQPVGQRRKNPILTRRPVSRLDPLWTAYENDELNRAQDALEAEYRAANPKTKKKINRESMVSVMDDDDERLSRRYSRNSEFVLEHYELPTPEVEQGNLSQEYLSEIRKSKLLNSQQNIAKQLKNDKLTPQERRRISKREKELRQREVSEHELRQREEQRKTLILDVKIPTVTRKSRHFTNSNKRLSVLTMRSTKESYRDLSSILSAKDDDEEDEHKMPTLRTSFADRLDRAGLVEEEDEEPLDEGSVMDFDEHLANKRLSYYAGANARRYSKYGNAKNMAQRPTSALPQSPDTSGTTDDLFATKNSRRRSKYSLMDDHHTQETDVFENIKLPDTKTKQKTKSMLPSAELMLLPETRPRKKQPYVAEPYQGQNSDSDTVPPTPPSHKAKTPLKDSTNRLASHQPELPVQQKRNRSFFRKISWSSKKEQLPSPAESLEEKKSGFFRWFSGGSSSHAQHLTAAEIRRFQTILPKQEMASALYALLNSWSNFGIKDLRNDTISYNITGGVSKQNAFDLKSCKFRIKINAREFNQKSEIVCARVKGSKTTTDTLFKEIEKVLMKEGVMDRR